MQVPEQSGGGICTGKILPPPKLELRGIAGTAEVRRSSEILSVNKQNSSLCGAPNLFIAKHAADVIGQLHGFDRLRLQGTLPPLYHPPIMHEHLRKARVLYKDFKKYTLAISAGMRAKIEAAARSLGRPVQYLSSSRVSKEEIARQLAAEHDIQEGVICVLSCQETDRAYEACPNRATRKLELRLRPKRCVHLYVYLFHELLGFMHVRFQTWFPFLVQIGLNGREWLARQMTKARIGFRREGNCFPFIEDFCAAQNLMDQQLRTDWQRLCNGLVETLNPIAEQVCAPLGLKYYWTAPETEYATDVLFRDPASLERLYPHLVHHGITSFGCENILRYLNHRPASFSGEVRTSHLKRTQGVRLKHWVNANSIKMYDKAQNVLRVEATINQPKDFRVLRAPTGQPEAPKKWRILRRSTADLHRRAQVSHAATERYLDAMSVVEDRTALAEEAATICRRVRHRRQSYRAINPFGREDAKLLQAVNDAKFTATGFCNADLRQALYGNLRDAALEKRRANKVTRLIRLLRAHGLLIKIPKANRYQVSKKGRRIITALLTARNADIEQLTKLAA